MKSLQASEDKDTMLGHPPLEERGGKAVEGGVALLEGPVTDSSALHGLLNKLLNMRVPILLLQRLEPVPIEAPHSDEPNGDSR